MAVAMIGPKFYAWDRNGKPLAFGKLFTYQARTNTPKDSYQSEDQVVPNTNPVILNGEGYANVYLDGSYKVVLKDSDDNEIWSADPVTGQVLSEWINCQVPTYVSTTTFKVPGNQVEVFSQYRPLRIENSAAVFAYTAVETSSYASGETTVVVQDAVISPGVISVCTSTTTANAALPHNVSKDRNAASAHDAEAVDYTNRTVKRKLDDFVTPGDGDAIDKLIMAIKYDLTVASSYGMIIGVQDYNAEEIGAGSVLISGYSGASNNRMPGKAQLRAIIGGYDNEITSGPGNDGANSAGLACCIFASHHSEIKNKANHCTITGGSFNIIDNGIYNTIAGGTGNQIIGTYNPAGLQNNFVTGARNICDGANNVMGGTDNNLMGVGAVVLGLRNQVGQSNGSDYSYVGGNGNSVERNYNVCFGFQNTVTFEYNMMFGRNNEGTGNYQQTGGRSALNALNYAVAHGFATTSDKGTAQKINYQLDRTTTDATTQNMSSIAQGLLGPALVEDSMITYKGTVRATDGTDMAVFDVEFAFLRASSTTTVVYNNSVTKGNTAGAAAWAAAFGGQSDGRLTVTGEAAKTITWYADIDYIVTPLTE